MGASVKSNVNLLNEEHFGEHYVSMKRLEKSLHQALVRKTALHWPLPHFVRQARRALLGRNSSGPLPLISHWQRILNDLMRIICWRSI
jgi:hypothetical protein